MAVINVVMGTPPEMVAAASEQYKIDPEGLLGPWLIGCCFDWLFTGLLLFQAHKYYGLFPNDARWIKNLVSVVVVLSVYKTIHDLLLVWTQCVSRFGNFYEVALGTWYIWAEPIVSQTLSFAAEAFFFYRCFRLTNRNFFVLGGLVATMTGIMVATVFLTIRLKIDPYYVPGLRRYAIPALAANVFIDVFITGTVTYKLYKSKTGFHDKTDTILNRLLALTWETALPPAISAILNMIFYVARPMNVMHMFFNIMTPRLYVFSLLHTLNARPSIRTGSKSGTDQEAHVSSDVRRATVSRHQLSVYKKTQKAHGQTDTIPVHVQTETVMHTAPSDEFQRKKPSSQIGHGSGHPVVTISTPNELSKFEEDNWSLGSSSSVTGKGDQKGNFEMYDVTQREEVL